MALRSESAKKRKIHWPTANFYGKFHAHAGHSPSTTVTLELYKFRRFSCKTLPFACTGLDDIIPIEWLSDEREKIFLLGIFPWIESDEMPVNGGMCPDDAAKFFVSQKLSK